MIRWLFPLFFSFVAAPNAWSSACCGGSFAAPTLIAGDERAQATVSLLGSHIAADVYTDGRWRKRTEIESLQTLKVEAAHIFQDRWQAGLSVPLVRRTRSGEESSGFGDINGSLGYEYLPEWNYNPWRPRGLAYFQLTLPTGRSILESEETYALDSRGRGFWAIGVGVLHSKIWGSWDSFLDVEIHHSFEKTVESQQISGTLNPGWGGSSNLGVGYSRSNFRMGAALGFNYEEPVAFAGEISSSGTAQRSTTGTLSMSYLASESWAGTLSYSDQTLFGSPLNTSLLQTVAVKIQSRWPR